MVDRALGGADLPARVGDAVAAGVDWVQIRDRDLEGAALLRHAEAVAASARSAATAAGRALRVIVNRRVDVALAIGADGVHLGFDAMDAASARALLPPDSLIGVSTHAPEEVGRAAGADYAHLAPIFAPLSKAGTRPSLGCAAIAQAAGYGVPVFAQGGIEASNAGEACAAGACGVAVTGAVLAAADVGAATEALRRALDATPRS